MGDVEVGVEAQLAQARADARDLLEQLVAQLAVGRVERLVGAEELLGVLVPLRAERDARLLEERRRRLERAAVRALGVGEDEPARRARHRDAEQAAHLGDVRGARVGRQALVQQLVGQRLVGVAARAGHPRAVQPEHEDVVELPPLRAAHRHHRDAARAARVGLLLAQPGLGDGGDRAGELPRRALRRAADVVGGQLAEPRQIRAGARRRRRWRRRAAGGAGRGARRGGGRRGRGASCRARPRTGGGA